jgi:hypothetical protein
MPSPGTGVSSTADRQRREGAPRALDRRPTGDVRPTHPVMAATFLMVGVALFLVLVAVAGL